VYIYIFSSGISYWDTTWDVELDSRDTALSGFSLGTTKINCFIVLLLKWFAGAVPGDAPYFAERISSGFGYS
jgi:hypothetical protein